MDEIDAGIEHSAPVFAVFGDLMAGLLGAFVLILVGVVGVQMELASELKAEMHKRELAEQRRAALEKALAVPLAAGRVTLDNGRIGISGSVLFALNSDELQPEGQQLLKSLATPLAAFLAVKLKHIDAWNRQRQAIADVYLRRLAGNADLRLPMAAPGTQAVWHLFVIRHLARDALRDKLAARGVETALHYPIANHRSGAFAATHGRDDFPVTDAICASCLSLPIGPHLSVEDADEIAGIVHETVCEL